MNLAVGNFKLDMNINQLHLLFTHQCFILLRYLSFIIHHCSIIFIHNNTIAINQKQFDISKRILERIVKAYDELLL